MRTSIPVTASLCILAFLFIGEVSAQQVVQLPSSWRGVYRYHRGPFGGVHETVRWGNGITPTGGVVLLAGFEAATQIVPAVVRERSLEDLEKDREIARLRLEILERDVRSMRSAMVGAGEGAMKRERSFKSDLAKLKEELAQISTQLDVIRGKVERLGDP